MTIGGKKALWDSLSITFSPLHGQFVVFGGDFNAISFDDEKFGGIFPNKRILEDFSTFIQNNDLVDCKTLNGPFTWTNRRKYFSQIAERLDHFLVSASWISSNVDVVALVLPYAGFDHFPILKIHEELEVLNTTVMNCGMNFATFQRHKILNSHFEEILSREEIYWRQKSRDLWLSDGDRNTKFFHSLAKLKRQHNRISCIQNLDGVVIIEEKEIAAEAVWFFKSLLSEETSVFNDSFAFAIPSLISNEDNVMLMSPFSIPELKEVVFFNGTWSRWFYCSLFSKMLAFSWGGPSPCFRRGSMQ
ncbi:uncharacterized protein LOC131876488 [Cryptomeria japonica]|uniref:uncharacterized protein LOC131876488 n=1 Tax=Cryptomeria japonica TaxID=3369 RepID=UPI0027D9DC86|nr:uncharacterized protein LOC131876488 [Cryptomeria japonica]